MAFILVYSVYFNGITPPDLGTFVRSDKFCSALSLRTLEVIFDDESPLRASHFKTLAQTCINLVKLKFGAALFFSNPVSANLAKFSIFGLTLKIGYTTARVLRYALSTP